MKRVILESPRLLSVTSGGRNGDFVHSSTRQRGGGELERGLNLLCESPLWRFPSGGCIYWGEGRGRGVGDDTCVPHRIFLTRDVFADDIEAYAGGRVACGGMYVCRYPPALHISI
mmetsp:Transcript_18836/g.41002  ORF Transcript_18836/g.41002 Transcript_18836/m.41002 type:complete len:115 (+) Transcript_18836:68-412(+)